MQALVGWTPSPEDFRAAQLITLLSLALLIGTGFVPAARPYQWRLSMAVIAIDVIALGAIFVRHLIRG